MVCLAAGQVIAEGVDSADRWIARMIDATRSLDFEGSFVYFNGSGISSARVVHEVAESGEEVQRLYALNGPEREVIRQDRKTTLLLSDGKELSYADQFQSSLFPLVPTRDLDTLATSYRFELGPEDRVAGRPCQEISIKPLDEYRYGYNLWLDRETAVLMRADLLDRDGKRLEQLMFTEITIRQPSSGSGAGNASSATREAATGEGAATVPQSADSSAVLARAADWRVEGGPPGFEEVYRARKASAPGEFTDHLVLSDGLATVSVHAQPLASAASAVEGESHMGAVSAYAKVVGEHQVYVVGEVPQATVRAVAEALRGPEDSR